MSASLASGLITRVASWRARVVGPEAHFGSDKQIAEVFLSLERDQGESLKNLSQVWIALEDVEISPEDVADGKVVRVVRDDGHWSVFVIISLPWIESVFPGYPTCPLQGFLHNVLGILPFLEEGAHPSCLLLKVRVAVADAFEAKELCFTYFFL